jgi:hypothetical protein
VLKNSLLQEIYLRGVAQPVGDSVRVRIRFNLHGFDCGAPDCYTTEVSFGLKLGRKITFPQNLKFREHEYGCVDKETRQAGEFDLVELTDNHVIYHSAKPQRTLVLFSFSEKTFTSAYYFVGLDETRISGDNVYNIARDYDDNDSTSIYPYMSWILNTNEYEYFLSRKKWGF